MRFRRVALAAGGVLLASWMGLAWLIDRAGVAGWNAYRVGAQEAVVVLGARVEESGAASQTLRARVEHGVKVLERLPRDAVILFSGGVGRYGASEASVARAIAIELGVPPERCLVEQASHSTLQNARFSMRALQARYPGGVHVTVVSDPYHLVRARMLFRAAAGRTVSTSPALEAPRHQAWPSRAWWALREVPALLKDRVALLALD